MVKLIGNLRIAGKPGEEELRPHYEIVFLPYSGRLNTKPVSVSTYDDLVAFLIQARLSEDEATRWAGMARSGGIVIIPSFERTEAQLAESGLLER